MCIACDIYEKEEIFIHVLVVKTDVKRNLGRLMDRPTRESNLKIQLQEIGWKHVGWNRLTHDTDEWKTL
jgi:hypothetical protein